MRQPIPILTNYLSIAFAALALLSSACVEMYDENADGSEQLEESTQALDTTYVTLRSYWNPTYGDNAVSSDPSFYRSGYTRYREEGLVFNPARAAPPNTRALYTWYSPSRGDYFTTTQTHWIGHPGDVREGYEFVRIEGYVYDRSVAGTLPLQLWWSPGRGDNFTTSDPRYVVDPSYPRSPDYRYVRTEGYLLPPTVDQNPAKKETFHFGTMGDGPTGQRDVLVLLMGFGDQPFRHTRSQYQQLVFGPGFPNVRDYVSQMSQGRFTWGEGAVVGPLTFPNDAQTAGNESLFSHSWSTSNPTMVYVTLRGMSSRLAAADGGGGSTTNIESTRKDSWQVWGLADLNGGALMSGDPVAFKALNDDWLRESSGRLRADGTSSTGSARFIIRSAAGGQILPGTSVTLQAWTGRYVSEVTSPRYLSVTETGTDSSATWFTLGKSAPDVARQMRGMARAAAASGYDFSQHDQDGDGQITADEVTLVIIAAGPSPWLGAATRSLGSFQVPGTSLTIVGGGSRVSSMGEDVSISSLAHEMLHHLGAADLYGASALNQNLTLMGATIFNNVDDRQVFHLDPWHKMRLGWVEPEIHFLNEVGASSLRRASSVSGSRPLLLFDPARYNLWSRSGEFFMVEYRNGNLSGYDADATGNGVAVWQIKTDQNGNLMQIARVPGSDGTVPPGTDASVNTFGAPSGARGGTTLWNASHGTITLRYIDGSDARFRLRVGPVGSSTDWANVEWTRDGVLRPRLDSGSTWSLPGSLMSVDGMFPVDSSMTQLLLQSTSSGTWFTLAPEGWTTSRVLARLPSTIPIGTYNLYMRQGSKYSNRRSFTVN